tara:strand:+ start:2660 stop:3010 length:351 start_codon:yes stop_codon:yes gene_type:complete
VQLNKEQLAYCAGLFDGEGCVMYKQYLCNDGYRRWRVTMEINMTEKNVLHYFMSTVNAGTLASKINRGFGRKLQWRWRCSNRKALRVAELLIPYSKVKHPKLRQILEHYGNKKFNQ